MLGKKRRKGEQNGKEEVKRRERKGIEMEKMVNGNKI